MTHEHHSVLQHLTNHVQQLGYGAIEHARFSVFDTQNKAHTKGQKKAQSRVYQGISRALSPVGETVLIKWQMTEGNVFADLQHCDETQERCHAQNTWFNNDLWHEIQAYQRTHARLAYASNSSETTVTLPIPRVIDWQQDFITRHPFKKIMTLMLPYFAHGSVIQCLKRYQETHKPCRLIDLKIMLITAMTQTLFDYHQLGWIHGDIKPSNFLVRQLDKNDRDVSTVLIDLAQARPIHQYQNVGLTNRNYDPKIVEGGTLAYLAPEIWQGESKTQASDVYAFGVSVFEILTSERPFVLPNINKMSAKSAKNKAQMWAKLHRHQHIPKLPKSLNQWNLWQEMLEQMLAKRAKARPTMQEVMLRTKSIVDRNRQQKTPERKL